MVAGCAPNAESDLHVFNRTQVVLQVGWAGPIAGCSDQILRHGDLNDTQRPLIEGAWRPTFSLAIKEGATRPTFWVVTKDRTDFLTEAPAILPACEGQPQGWAP
jgi:hypothetical protein